MSKSNHKAGESLSVRLKNSKFYKAISPARKSGSAQTAAGPSQSSTHFSPNSVPVTSGQAPQRLVTPNKSFTPDPVFKNVIEAYVAKLSDDDKADFQFPWDIMSRMKEMDEKNAKESLSRTFGARIEKLLQLMNSFMNSVAICIQSNPEVSSLIVGGINCALSLVLGYIQFFESLTSMMEQIGGHLDYLSKFSLLTFRNSPDVQNALVRAYCDLLDFFVAVRGVFKNGNATYLKSFKLFLRITWEPFESKFKPIQDRFMDHTLIVVRSAGVQDLIMRYEKGTQEDLKQKVEKRRKVLGWLSPIDYEEIHQKHFKKHFGDTGQWFLDHPDFGTWKDALGQRLLWCHGMPGTGKTVLASLVVEKLSAQYELSNNVGISFVYCNYKEPQEAAVYVRLFIKQLSRRMNELPVELEALYDKHYSNASTPGYTELQEVLMRISKRFEKVFLVLDALDECTGDQRRELFEVLHGIVSPGATNPGNINLFITSRKEQDIQHAFRKFPIIEIEAKKVNEDIESYITAQLDQYLQDGTLMITNTLKCKILTALVHRAGGMFLWVEFQLKHILSLTSYHDIEGALESLPEDMEQTYERIIRLIHEKPKPQRKLARRVLMWVAYAERPLRLRELVYAVAMENETRDGSELKSMAPTAEALVGVCANLIVLDGRSVEHSTARFVHFSVQEFLKSPSLGSNFSVATLNIGPTIAHTEIARLCINFLLFCKSFNDFYLPLITYAYPAWVAHVRALTEIDKELMLLILELFEFGAIFDFRFNRSNYRASRRISRRTSHRTSTYQYIRLSHTKFSPSTFALILDLPLVSEYLEKGEFDQQSYPDDLYAMHYAARHNSCNAIERLCDQGFSVSLLDGSGCVPLHYATSKEAVRLILDKGADVNAQGGEYGNALQAAIYTCKNETVRLLLDRGADVNAQGGGHGNALQAAAYCGWEETVQLLLDRGADVNAQGGEYGNALQVAVYQGWEEIVQLLLDRGADVNAQGGEYGNALQAAVYACKNETVQLLLDRGADVNAQGGGHGNALQAAACCGREETVQLLLDRGADVNAQGGKYGNALQAAAIWGREEILQLLLDRGAIE